MCKILYFNKRANGVVIENNKASLFYSDADTPSYLHLWNWTVCYRIVV